MTEQLRVRLSPVEVSAYFPNISIREKGSTKFKELQSDPVSLVLGGGYFEREVLEGSPVLHGNLYPFTIQYEAEIERKNEVLRVERDAEFRLFRGSISDGVIRDVVDEFARKTTPISQYRPRSMSSRLEREAFRQGIKSVYEKERLGARKTPV